jgi:hypothetical protein
MKRKAMLAFTVAIAAGFAAATATNAGDMDGVKMSAGRMIVVKGDKRTPLDQEMTMANGTKVEPDGTLNFTDGQKTHLENGQMIMNDGHIMRGGKAAAMQQ